MEGCGWKITQVGRGILQCMCMVGEDARLLNSTALMLVGASSVTVS